MKNTQYPTVEEMKREVRRMISGLRHVNGSIFLTERDVQAYIYSKLPSSYRQSNGKGVFPYSLVHCDLRYKSNVGNKGYSYADMALLDKTNLRKSDFKYGTYKILIQKPKGISIEIKYSDYHANFKSKKRKNEFTNEKNYRERFLPRAEFDIKKLVKAWDYGFFICVSYSKNFRKRIESDLKRKMTVSQGKKLEINCISFSKPKKE